jgi:glutathione S-transferase
MLELYQFEASSFAEKIRLILDYKQVPYRKVEVTPGVGQVEVFQMSGQRQVPVLKDGEQVIPDSTAIALYVEKSLSRSPPHSHRAQAKGPVPSARELGR